MSPRTWLVTASTAIAATALSVSSARAQARMSPGSHIEKMPAADKMPAANFDGTGPYAVVATGPCGTISYGNATVFLFKGPGDTSYHSPNDDGHSSYASDGPGIADVIQPATQASPPNWTGKIEFAPNNRLAPAISRNGCLAEPEPSQGTQAPTSGLTITYASPQEGTYVYSLLNVHMIHLEQGAQVVATFQYPEYDVVDPSSAGGRSRHGP